MRLVNLLGLPLTGLSALCLIDFYIESFAGNSSAPQVGSAAQVQVERIGSSPVQRPTPAVSLETTPISFNGVAARLATPTRAQNDAPKSVQAGDLWARRELAVEIKRGLKRLGCFDGSISGDWDRSAQLATSAFLATVNARLPVSEPDLILLALVRAQVSQVCAVECSEVHAGRATNECPPSVNVAEGGKSSADATTFYTAERMSLGALATNDVGDTKSASTNVEPGYASKRSLTLPTVSVRRSTRVAVQAPTSWSKRIFDGSSGR